MSMMGNIEAMQLQWYAVGMKQPQNRGRRTTILGADFETFRDRQGRPRKRRVAYTGKRVFVPEHLLLRAGFEVFLPIKKEWRRKNRFGPDNHLVAKPLMADWLFVGWAVDQRRWHELMALDVVAGVMGTGGRPVLISEIKILQMMRRWGGGHLSPEMHRLTKTEFPLSEGDSARVVAGPLDGASVRIVEILGPTVKAAVNMLGAEFIAEIRSELLEPRDQDGC